MEAKLSIYTFFETASAPPCARNAEACDCFDTIVVYEALEDDAGYVRQRRYTRYGYYT